MSPDGMREAQQSLEEQFSRQQVERILGISERQLAAWERQGLVRPSCAPQPGAAGRPERSCSPAQAKQGYDPGSKRRLYSFSDIITLKTLLKLRRNGVPLARIRLALASLQRKLAGVERPLSELPLTGWGRHLSVHFQGATMEPVTGQLLLEYSPGNREAKIQPLRPLVREKKSKEASQQTRAERFFLAGIRYEEAVDTLPKAIRAYQRAMELNPQAAGAFINLGTIYYNLGRLADAESCYRSALSIDPDYGLVYFNLGNVFDERNELEKARQHYEEAVRRDPGYIDARYNLALVYEKMGQHGKARQQWRSYLKLDPASLWSSYARQQLEKTPLRIVPQEKSPQES